MTELLILAALTVVGLLTFLWYQNVEQNKEREQWRQERRFLIDRAIASDVGEVVALDRIDQKGKAQPRPEREHVPTTPLGI